MRRLRRGLAPLLAAVVGVFAVGGSAGNCHAGYITFDPLAESGAGFVDVGGLYSEGDYTLLNAGLASGSIFRSPREGNVSFFAGSAALFNSDPLGETQLWKNDGGLFDILSIDLTPWQKEGAATTGSITFTGYRPDSTTVSQIVTLHSTFGFQTYSLTGFTNLAKVTWSQSPSNRYQFDNVQIEDSAVIAHSPEPGTAVLLGLGGACLAIFRVCRSKKRGPIAAG